MEVLTKHSIIKKILIVLIIIVMLNNFIMPTYVHAKSEPGGKLFTPISAFLMGIFDRILATLQAMFVGKTDNLADEILSAGSIANPTTPTDETSTPWAGTMAATTYSIRYSPAIIFSGMVPAFDINYINPMSEKERTFDYEEKDFELLKYPITVNEMMEKYNIDEGSVDSRLVKPSSASTWLWYNKQLLVINCVGIDENR